MIDGRTVMEVDPNGRSARRGAVALWAYISDRLEKNFRRTVFAPPAPSAVVRHAASRRRGASAAAWWAVKGMAAMGEPEADRSLSSGLLARKGHAKPAMRPQGFAASA